MNKGMQLPINVMVGLAVAVVVMLALVAFFMGGIGPTARHQTTIQNFNNCCLNYVLTGCQVDGGIAVNIQCRGGNIHSLAALAGIETKNIPTVCGCSRTSTGTTTASIFGDSLVGWTDDGIVIDDSKGSLLDWVP